MRRIRATRAFAPRQNTPAIVAWRLRPWRARLRVDTRHEPDEEQHARQRRMEPKAAPDVAVHDACYRHPDLGARRADQRHPAVCPARARTRLPDLALRLAHSVGLAPGHAADDVRGAVACTRRWRRACYPV